MGKTEMKKPTVGSLFAGIGGFDLGFEQAGFQTAWQVEIDEINRAVLSDRFPHAQQFADVRTALPDLWPVDVIVGGFPCQDVSIAGKRKGLAGERTGLFYDAMHIVDTLKPRWLVLETLQACSIQTMAKTFRKSSSPLPNAGMWDFGACLMQHISESPRHAAAFSWSQVWERSPQSGLWLTPGQLESFLNRLKRMGKAPTIRCLEAYPMSRSTGAVRISSLSETDGVRWLSGRERLKIMGFDSEWMRPTMRRLGLPETPSVRRSRVGLPKS